MLWPLAPEQYTQLWLARLATPLAGIHKHVRRDYGHGKSSNTRLFAWTGVLQYVCATASQATSGLVSRPAPFRNAGDTAAQLRISVSQLTTSAS